MEYLAIGKRIKALREEKGISQKDAAQQIGIQQSTLSKYERGKQDPRFKELCLVADGFGVSVDYLLCRTEIPSIPTDGKLQAAAEITGFSEKALSKLSEFKAMNQKTQYTDTLSLLIESMNMEYLLALMTALISQNVKSNNAHNGNDTEIVRYLIDATMPLDIDGTKVNIYKSTLLSSALQNAIVDTIDMISEKISENGGNENGQHNPSP